MSAFGSEDYMSVARSVEDFMFCLLEMEFVEQSV